MTKEWIEKVYHEKNVDYKLQIVPTRKVKGRDKRTCQSCRKRLASNQCSIHHIIPRDEGGTSTLDNLITLCKDCHNLIELAEPPIRTSREIKYYKKSLDERERQLLEEQAEQAEIDAIILPHQTESERDANRPAWHKHVYGGVKKR